MSQRPIPLSALEDSLYRSYALRQDTLLRVPKKKKNEHLEFWGSWVTCLSVVTM